MKIAKLTFSLALVGLALANPQYPSGTGGNAPVTVGQCTAYTHGCVPYYQCVNGYINTDGAGLIDVRIKGENEPVVVSIECTNPEHPEVPAVCCGIPGATTPVPPTPAPLVTCPNGLVCVDNGQCNSDGTVNTDGVGLINTRFYSRCYVNSGSNAGGVGICCQPPPLDTCYNNQVCLPSGQCSANVAAVGTAFAQSEACFIDKANYVTGVCCDPPIRVIDVCPDLSVCLPEILCQGDILDQTNNYVPYGNSGSWSQCYLSGDIQSPGVCCRNPVVVPENPYVPAGQCGISNSLGVRSQDSKLNKNEALFGEFPWQAVIFFSNFTFKCGASLVADRWLVTGAHCVSGYTYGDFKVRLGEWQVNTYDEPLPYVDYDIASITVHPDFNPTNLWNDFAVLELATPVQFEYHINTVCLPTPHQALLPGTRCYATGWGKDAFDGEYQAILKKVDVPFVEYSYCQDLLRQTRLGKFYQLDKSFMCAGGEVNQDACTGDGGGPLVCLDQSGTFVLWGITAWGINCGQLNVPGVYADVQFAADWISNVIYGTPVAEVTQPHNPYGRK